MSFWLEFLRCILCCEEDDYADRDYYDSRRRISAPTCGSYQTFFHHVPVQTFERIRTFIPRRTTEFNSAQTPGSYRAPTTSHNTSSSGGAAARNSERFRNPAPRGNNGGANDIIRTGNTRSMERNHRVLENSSQTSYSPRAYSIPPNSVSSLSVKTVSFKPELPSSSQPKADIASPPSSPPNTPPSTSKLPSFSSNSLPLFKPTLSLAPSTSTNRQAQANYIWVQNGSLPIYKIPKDTEDMFKNGIVPGVLQQPLSPSTYADYFAALLYAEDYYMERWSKFVLKRVPLVLEKADSEKVFVAFKIDAANEKRPFILSRDFVLAKPTGKQHETFKGVIRRVVKSTKILVEFGDEFHSQHQKGKEYDVSFSFNRVYLRRAHQAVAAAADPLLRSLLFPDYTSMTCISDSTAAHLTNNWLILDQLSAVQHILHHQVPSPYLLEGSVRLSDNSLSRVGVVVREVVLELYRRSLGTRILVCGPVNSTLDFMFKSLKSDIPEPEMFRVNAAFRDKGLVLDDVLSSCLYDDECFVFPQLQKLKQFRVVFTTFISAFRLYIEGITAGHFSHIFLIDSSTAPEPETMIALANLVNEKTSVTVMGEDGKRPGWIRSDIARKNGLGVSYFQRLRLRGRYQSKKKEKIDIC